MSKQEPGITPTPAKLPWAIPVANVFRVIAPESEHRNKKEGSCPPYPWAIVCDCDTDSVGGEQAAANAKLIVEAVNSHASLVERVRKLEEALKAILRIRPANQCILTKEAAGLEHYEESCIWCKAKIALAEPAPHEDTK